MKKLQGHVVRLVRSILLRPPSPGRHPSAQFFAGKRPSFVFTGGIGISWWYSGDTRKALEAVGSLLIQSSEEFRDCDLESVVRCITDTLQEICVDNRFFDPDAVVFGGRKSLFDCRRPIAVEDFSSSILAAIAGNLRAQIGDRCTVYALSRFKGATLHLWSEGVHAIAATDDTAWGRLAERGFKFNGWTPLRPQYANGGESVFRLLNYSYVFASEERGTERGARFNATLKLRKLISVLCAVVSSSRPYPLPKSAADPYRMCIQFPNANCPEANIVEGECGALLPYYAVDVLVSDEALAAVERWYGAVETLPAETSGRVAKCAHFINRAMNADDIESFIGYFVALDALFGERGFVESSIVNGVAALPIASVYREKAAWLFDLRNELVHGGSRYVSEWPKYQRYYRHFDARPEEDVRALAMAALLAAPAVMPL